ARLGNRLVSPRLPSSVGWEGNKEAPAGGVGIGAARNAGDHLALGYHGAAGERVAPAIISHCGVPHDLAGPCVESHDMRICACQEDLLGVERDRASCPIEEIVVIATFDFRKLAPVLPKQIAGAA